MDKPFSNIDIVIIAVYLLGGASKYVDTEDVAIKVNELPLVDLRGENTVTKSILTTYENGCRTQRIPKRGATYWAPLLRAGFLVKMV